ncbi:MULTISPECIES: tRNA (adenosine(37)-N6)-threonylcarbamoyltransferase complex transferase subunit TsaD [unclassified Adlercreutzia]|uniref:tRNA (adenosine(37)-N6)-threonylcarbamoyltransferase complex transferase subunit TsaD n=1 Tax=unclassified Adlercreutzia TaxID=2636013 RepID=UPI001F14BA85|nr:MULTISPECIES: tRNA (adenosine(37)-N6)-threonylcarbamoyltransferase complex transferase subunit TsaD [unclassified Adlercreutzia]
MLAFDTANEVISIGVGALDAAARSVALVAAAEVAARRASNTQLLPRIDALLRDAGVAREDIACVAVGRGPGSFTGVRIAMATAKGIASALEVGLVGVSTLDAVAWGAWRAGVRGHLLVAADAMRKEVYPVEFDVSDAGTARLGEDRVVKADACAKEYAAEGADPAAGEGAGQLSRSDSPASHGSAAGASGSCGTRLVSSPEPSSAPDAAEAERGSVAHSSGQLLITGDALRKYADLFAACGVLLPEEQWTPTGAGLLLALQAAWRAGEADPLDARRHDPVFALPVYTRLSDAEEAERARLARADQALAGARGSKHVTMNDTAIANARANGEGIAYKPLDAAHVANVAALEERIMGSDAWSAALVADELGRADRVWWAAFAADPSMPLPPDAPLVGYAGGWVVDGDVQILKVGTAPEHRRRGIAAELVARVAADARNLGARTSSLEVRAANAGAQALYAALGYASLGVRPRYYSDGEDALIMKAEALPAARKDVAGMELQRLDDGGAARGGAGAAGAGAFGAGATGASASAAGTGADAGASALAADAGPASEPVRPLILAIESSCDETAAAVVNGDGILLSDVVASQIDFHARFGGVVPEIASRKHIEAICGVCDECLDVAAARLGGAPGSLRWRDLDAVAVTYAPGLVGALVVGVAFAKGAAWAAGVPFIGVHHLEGHLYANKVGAPDFAPPAVVSLVSGGNTLLVHMRDWGDYATLGATIDDAVGEAFDKVAKALGLGYPGGPVISRYAKDGNPEAIAFPRAMMHSGDLRFSLSGLKTAVVTYVNQERAAGRELDVPDVCASFQQAVVDVQVAKAKRALEETGARTFCLGGGVAANPVLRAAYEELCAKMRVRLVMPPLHSCGDNAGMIALVALDRYRAGRFFGLDADAQAHADLDEPY